jgi:hypothetical protein
MTCRYIIESIERGLVKSLFLFSTSFMMNKNRSLSANEKTKKESKIGRISTVFE